MASRKIDLNNFDDNLCRKNTQKKTLRGLQRAMSPLSVGASTRDYKRSSGDSASVCERTLRMSGTNSSSVSWSLSEDHLQTITWVLEGLLLPTVGLVGVVANLVSLRVIHRADLKLKPSFLRLVSTLMVFDTACILLTMALFSGPKIDATYRLQVREVLI